VSGQEQQTELDSRDWKVVGIVLLFAAGLPVSGVMRFYNLRAEKPSPLTVYALLTSHSPDGSAGHVISLYSSLVG